MKSPNNTNSTHSSIYTKICSHDLFGHKINMNFNKQGNIHKTLVGGICSIVMKLCIVAYVVFLFLKLCSENGYVKIIRNSGPLTSV